MIVALFLLVQQATGQPFSSVTVRNGDRATTVPVVLVDRGPVVAADALVDALSGQIEPRARDEFMLSIAGLRVLVTPNVPFVRIGTETLPLTAEPVLRSGKLFLPYAFVSDFLPRLATGVTFDSRRAVLQRQVASTALPGTGRDKPKLFTVVVDAGHGGPDRGMHGPIGANWEMNEKDITLDVAMALRDALSERGVAVVMTRSTDTLIALSDRGRIANARKGDIFVSIHVNAANPRWKQPAAARGFETYFLSEARTEDARRVEAMENEVVKYEVAGNVAANDPLSFIVHDMEQNQHLRESSELAATVQRSLAKMHPGPNRGVKQAGFRVLVTAFMPAVLVEIGFGTNNSEARYLRDPKRQREIASSIADATMQYLVAYQRRSNAAGQ
jgi:N-acetylmuramoyl-L-alanine amidase